MLWKTYIKGSRMGVERVALPYLKVVGNFSLIDPYIFTFSNLGVSSLHGPTWSHWPPLSAEKICLFLSHLVPKIIGLKIALILHQNLSSDSFKSFCSKFILAFTSVLLISCFIRSFWPLILTKSYIQLGPFWSFAEPPIFTRPSYS